MKKFCGSKGNIIKKIKIFKKPRRVTLFYQLMSLFISYKFFNNLKNFK